MRYRLLLLLGALVLVVASCDESAEIDRETSLSEGDRAPAFSLPSVGGGNVSLSDFSGDKPVLLYFSMGPG